MAGEMGGEFLI